MSFKKVWEEVRGNKMAKVFKDSEYGCFTAVLYTIEGPKVTKVASCEESDLKAAIGTAKAELDRMGAVVEQPRPLRGMSEHDLRSGMARCMASGLRQEEVDACVYELQVRGLKV